jgi:type I protein arginine methyltransferase
VSYSLFGYRQMAADPVRMEAYARALARVVRPGCTVLDIGAGTGAMSILACRLGAARVVAVEPDSAVRLVRDNAEANGCADRVEVVQGNSLDLSLPGGADVIVSDLRGVLPLHPGHLPAVLDARQRLLAPGGVMIPLRDRIRGALVEDASVYERHAPLRVEPYGITLDASRRLTSNLWTRVRVGAEALLCTPADWAEIDYRTALDGHLRAPLLCRVERAGTAHGFCLWFDAELAEGIGYSGAPGEAELVYGHGFFPFPDPVPLREGDVVEVRLRADPSGNEYVWSWDTEVRPAAGEPRAFRQSSLRGALLSLDDLRRGAPQHRPVLSTDGELEREILLRMDGSAAVAEIATAIAARFPHRFPAPSDAMDRVAAVARRLGR